MVGVSNFKPGDMITLVDEYKHTSNYGRCFEVMGPPVCTIWGYEIPVKEWDVDPERVTSVVASAFRKVTGPW